MKRLKYLTTYFIVIDDDPALFSKDMSNLYVTNPRHGLQDTDVKRIQRHFSEGG